MVASVWKSDEQTFRALLKAFRANCVDCCAANTVDGDKLCQRHRDTLGSQRFLDGLLELRWRHRQVPT